MMTNALHRLFSALQRTVRPRDEPRNVVASTTDFLTLIEEGIGDSKALADTSEKRIEVLQRFTALYREPFPTVALLWLLDPNGEEISAVLWSAASSAGLVNWPPEDNASMRLTWPTPAPTMEALRQGLSIFGREKHPHLDAYVRMGGVNRAQSESFIWLHDHGLADERTSLTGVLQVVSEDGAGPIHSQGVQDHAGALLSWWLSLERRSRLLTALQRVQNAVRAKVDSRALAMEIANIIREATNAIDCSIYTPGTDGTLTRFAATSEPALSAFCLPHQSFTGWLLSGEGPKTVRLHDLRAPGFSHPEMSDAPAMLPEEIPELISDVPLSWLSATGVTPAADPEAETPFVIVRLLNNRRVGSLGGTFSQTDAVIANILTQYMADLLPGLITSEMVATARTELKQIRHRYQARINEDQFFARELHTCRLIVKALPWVEAAFVVHGTTNRGDHEMFMDSNGDHHSFAPPFSWDPPDFQEPATQTIRMDQKGRFIDATIYATHLQRLGLRLEFKRWPVPQHEMQFLNFIVSEMRAAALGDLALDENLVQIAEIRHALRAGLTGAIEHLRTATLAYNDALEFYRAGDTATAVRIAFDQGNFRKSMDRARLSGEQVESFFEDARLLLADMTPSSLQISNVDIPELVREIRSIYHLERQRRRLEIDLENEPSVHAEHYVGDRTLLRLALFNLIDNAVKYSFSGNRISIHVGLSRQHWLISVENIGRHIPVPLREAIFIPLKRVRAERGFQEMPGTGLGLAATRRVAELHGGDVQVESVIQDNSQRPARAKTTFTLRLPRAKGR